MQTHMRAHTHTNIYTHRQTDRQTRAHTHTHTHTFLFCFTSSTLLFFFFSLAFSHTPGYCSCSVQYLWVYTLQTNRDQQQEELGVLRSRLQHQIHSQLQATQPRRLAIVPPLPRCTSTPMALADCAPTTPGGVDCTTTTTLPSGGVASCSSHPPTPGGVANCSPHPASNCSPHPAASSCSPHPATPGGSHCSPHPLTPGMSGCSPHPCTPGGTGHGMVGNGNGGGGHDLVSAPKLCSSSLEKHGSSLPVMSQGQTLLQDLLDFDPWTTGKDVVVLKGEGVLCIHAMAWLLTCEIYRVMWTPVLMALLASFAVKWQSWFLLFLCFDCCCVVLRCKVVVSHIGVFLRKRRGDVFNLDLKYRFHLPSRPHLNPLFFLSSCTSAWVTLSSIHCPLLLSLMLSASNGLWRCPLPLAVGEYYRQY